VVVALPPGADRRPAAQARATRTAVDTMTGRTPSVERCAHELGGRLERATAVGLVDVAQAAPRRERRGPERLGEPHVADPGDDRLVEERLAEPPRLVGGAQAGEHGVDPRRPLED